MKNVYLKSLMLLLMCIAFTNILFSQCPPPAPTNVTGTPNPFCPNTTVQLNATTSGVGIEWYTVATGGVSLGSSLSGANFAVVPAGPITYYAEAFDYGAGGGGSQFFSYTGSMQTFTVPAGITSITITARGAQGGAGGTAVGGGGLGADMTGTFTVTPGQVLNILVGGMGGGSNATPGAGGGGGTFVTDVSNNPMVVAGGGGGIHGTLITVGVDANITTNGNDGYSDVSSPPYPLNDGIGGINGNGATGNSPHAGNGGGLLTGGAVAQCGGPGAAYVGGGAGGTSCTANIDVGGYGGGGGGGNNGGGGGGGYSGGGGAYHTPTNGGGGGSYNGGTNQNNFVGQSGNGEVLISWSGTPCYSTTRTPVSLTTGTPAAPTNVTASPDPFCLNTVVNLNATSGGSINWYTVPTGGTAIGFSASGANFGVIPPGTTTYYAETVTGGGAPAGQTFIYTGSVQNFTVPLGVTSIDVDIRGGSGGQGTTGIGGLGGRVQSTLTVTSGQALEIYVGGAGGSFNNTAGYNGGGYSPGSSYSTNIGGGGGASDIRVSPYSLNDRIVVAGGGGAGGYNGCTEDGGAGGGTTGVAGALGCGTTAAGGGTGIGGGAGGTYSGWTSGTAGTLGVGGSGGSGTGGAGGGGGYYGGGGGSWQGGGGGSSYSSGAGTIHTQGFQSGNGQVTLSWITAGNCFSATRTPVTVTLDNTIPAAPTSATANPDTFCAGLPVNLSAIAVGDSIEWYDAASGGTFLGGTQSGANFTITPAGNTTYYAQTISNCSGLPSSTRIPVTVVLGSIPPPYGLSSNPDPFCLNTTVQLTGISNGDLYWFTAPTGGTLLGSSPSGANFGVNPTGTTTYYAEAGVGSISGTQTFSFTGSMQTFTVPGGVNTITIDAYGAEGIGMNGFTPGQGGHAQGDLSVIPGQVLNIFVGGQSSFNGGGAGKGGANGGDASDVRVGGITLNDRVIVAGGGGGAGGDNWSCFSGNGDGGGGLVVGTNFIGGGGGSGYSFCGGDGGNTGGTSSNATHGGGGGGGGLTSGGAGAASSAGTAASGALGIGGDALMSSSCVATGGGGGGYYGGGGAAGNNCGAGQGGGGSSWTGSLANPLLVAGVQSGNGQVILTWSGSGLCVSATRTPLTVTLDNTIPAAPSSATASPDTFCAGSVVSLSAIAVGDSIEWYDAASGGTFLGGTQSGGNLVVSPPGTTTYYAQTISTCSGLPSTSRTPITATLGVILPPSNVMAIPDTFCLNTTVQLTGTSVGDIYWYTAPTGGTLLGSSLSGANFPVNPAGTTTYYAETVTGGGVGGPGSQTFTYTGGMQTFTVPMGVTSLTLDCYGAEGIGMNGFAPGQGGRAKADITVTPGQVINIYVGGQVLFNGGGAGKGGANGGDASDVRVGGTAVSNRVIVAGGGGGAGGDNWSCFSGNGDGGGGTAVGANFVGGGGGSGYSFCGTNGGNTGGTSSTATHGGGGGGGGLISGGQGAASSIGTALSGALGQGGDAYMSPSCNATGGGGGGYYGGGGAAGNNCGAGQGGGGSSWTGTLTNPLFAAGVQAGNGQVIITWTAFNGCISATRTPVTVTLDNSIPPDPTNVTSNLNNVCIGTSVNLTATSVGNTIQWYNAPTGGTFLGSSASGANFAVVVNATTTYYAQTLSTCSGLPSANRVPVTVDLDATVPPDPTGVIANPTTFCIGATVNLSATSAGNTIQWYLAPTGGVTIGSSASGANFAVNPAGTTTYYAESVSPCSGLGSATRIPVTVTQDNTIPPAPTNVTANPNSTCTGATVQLNATSAGNNIQWYTAPTGGTLLGTSASGANFAVVVSVTTTYYAETVSLCSGLGSTTRTPVTVTIGSVLPPTNVTGTPPVFCPGSTVQLNATAVGGSINWYTVPTGGVLLGNSLSGVNFPVNPAGTTTYYAETSTGGGGGPVCVSPTRTPVTVTIDNVPPTISWAGGIQTLNSGAGCLATVPNYTNSVNVTVSDNCSPPTVTQSPAAGSTVSTAGTITLTATDAAGNVATTTFVYVLSDLVPPVIDWTGGPQMVALNASCIALTPDFTTSNFVNASDNCGTPTVTQSPPPGSNFVGSGVVILTATDANGNVDTTAITIIGIDSDGPTITPPATQTIALDSMCYAPMPNLVPLTTAVDNCQGAVITQLPLPGSPINGTTPVMVIMTATDAANNASNASVMITPTLYVPNIYPAGATTICQGSSLLLNAPTNIGYTYQWYKDGVLITSANLNHYSVTTTGSYTVNITVPGACTMPSNPVVVTVVGVDITVTPGSNSLTSNANSAIYQWIDCNNNYQPVAGASAQTFTPAMTGSYAVIVTQNGCTDTSACYEVMALGVLESSFSHQIKTYPNPTSGKVTIDLGTEYPAIEVKITSVIGATITKEHFTHSQLLQLEMPATAGTYFVNISLPSGEKATVRVIKE